MQIGYRSWDDDAIRPSLVHPDKQRNTAFSTSYWPQTPSEILCYLRLSILPRSGLISPRLYLPDPARSISDGAMMKGPRSLFCIVFPPHFRFLGIGAIYSTQAEAKPRAELPSVMRTFNSINDNTEYPCAEGKVLRSMFYTT